MSYVTVITEYHDRTRDIKRSQHGSPTERVAEITEISQRFQEIVDKTCNSDFIY